MSTLDELLEQSPSPAAWFSVCGALDGMAGDALEGAMALVDERTKAWADEVRKAPLSWAESLLGDDPNSRLAVSRFVTFGGGSSRLEFSFLTR